MTQVRRPLIAALALFAGAITLDRVGLSEGGEAIATHAYVVAIIVFAVPLLSSLARRAATWTGVVAAVGAYSVTSLVIGAGPLSDGGIYLATTEFAFVTLAAWLGSHLAGAVSAFDDVVALAVSGDSPAVDLEGPTAANEIQAELARSRRHDRPMSVTVLGPTPSQLDQALERAAIELDRSVRTRFLFGSLARSVAKTLRRSDLLFEHRPSGRLIVVSPETDEGGTSLLVRRILTAATGAGIEVHAGTATFPDDGIGFEALVDHAETELAASTEPVLRALHHGVTA